MILYSSSVLEFLEDVETNKISDLIEDSFIKKMGRRPASNEKNSWVNSLPRMGTIVRRSKVSSDCGVLVEYNIPTSSKRVDFIITGQNQEEKDNLVIIELKQWNWAKETDKKDVIETRFQHSASCPRLHPSYQAWSYQELISDMNTAVYKNNIISHSCAYLHNYKEKDPEPLTLSRYNDVISLSPIFFKDDTKKLEDFLFRYVGKGKGMDIMYQIVV